MKRKTIETVAFFLLFSALLSAYWQGMKDGKKREQIRQENKRYHRQQKLWRDVEDTLNDA